MQARLLLSCISWDVSKMPHNSHENFNIMHANILLVRLTRSYFTMLTTSYKLFLTFSFETLFSGPIDDVVPTIGFSNLEMKLFNKFPVEIYDLGGGPKIRSIWKNYFALVHGIIYVIDSANESRIPEVTQNLQDVMKHDRISKKPILM